MKKLLSCLVSIGVLTSTLLSFGSSTSFAATQSVLLGDANGDNKVTYADVGAIQQYLLGYCPVTAKSFTGMDVNQDKIIDSTDAYIIQYRLAYNISAPTVQKELYTLPDNSTRSYKKYTCDTGATTNYTLSNSTTSSNADFDYPVATVSEEFDNENTNVVRLVMDDGSAGSGFVISDHIIATAAHCVLDENNNFVTGLTVKIYNENAAVNSSNLIASFEAESYHIPDSFLNRVGNYSNDFNYDYALIYVGTDSQGKDLLDYTSAWNFAIPSLEFSEAQTGYLTVSGFTTHSTPARYYSTGTVKDFSSDPEETHNIPNLRIASNAESYSGKSGGVMYYTSTYNTTTHKSVVGITASSSADYKSWGTRITPTLLRFYKLNPYI